MTWLRAEFVTANKVKTSKETPGAGLTVPEATNTLVTSNPTIAWSPNTAEKVPSHAVRCRWRMFISISATEGAASGTDAEPPAFISREFAAWSQRRPWARQVRAWNQPTKAHIKLTPTEPRPKAMHGFR